MASRLFCCATLVVALVAHGGDVLFAQASSTCVFPWSDRNRGARESYSTVGGQIGTGIGSAVGGFLGAAAAGWGGGVVGSLIGGQVLFPVGQVIGWIFPKKSEYDDLLDRCFETAGDATFVRVDELGREHVRMTMLPGNTGSVTFSTLSDGVEDAMMDAEHATADLERLLPRLKESTAAALSALPPVASGLWRYHELRQASSPGRGNSAAALAGAIVEISRAQQVSTERANQLNNDILSLMQKHFDARRAIHWAQAPAYRERLARLYPRLDRMDFAFTLGDRVLGEANILTGRSLRSVFTQQLMVGPALLPPQVASAAIWAIDRSMNLEFEERVRLVTSEREQSYAKAYEEYRLARSDYEEASWAAGPSRSVHDQLAFPLRSYGMTRLHYAAWYGLPTLTDRILTGGASSEWPASAALLETGGRIEIIGADGNVRVVSRILTESDSQVELAVMEAYGGIGSDKIIRMELREAGIINRVDQTTDVNVVDSYRRTALHYAAYFMSGEEVAKVLLEHDADVGAVDEQRHRTPLHYAAESGEVATARVLLEHGAEVNAKDRDGMTPLHYAARASGTAVAGVLLEHGAEVNAKDRHGMTPLHYAVPDMRTVELLLQKGANVEARAGNDYTPLFEMVMGRDWSNETAALLVRYGVDLESQVSAANSRVTVLHGTVFSGDVSRMRWLLEQGVDVQSAGSNGITALHRAATSSTDDMATVLLEYGARVDAVTIDGATPLHFAAESGTGGDAGYRSASIPTLLRYGANIEARDTEGRTPLEYARRANARHGVELLIEHGASTPER